MIDFFCSIQNKYEEKKLLLYQTKKKATV